MSALISRAFKGAALRKPGYERTWRRERASERAGPRNVKPDPFNYPVWNSRSSGRPGWKMEFSNGNLDAFSLVQAYGTYGDNSGSLIL